MGFGSRRQGLAHRRSSRAAAAVTLFTVAAFHFVPSHPSSALGPVVAITPYEVISNGYVGYVYHPSLSNRGEVVGIFDQEVYEASVVQLDTPGADPMVRSEGNITVSGDSCVSLWIESSGSTDPNRRTAFKIINRCAGFERVIGFAPPYNSDSKVSLSFDGRFAVVQFPSPFASEFVPNRIVRIDTETLEQRSMPVPAGFYAPDSTLGLDVSDDGNIVVVPVGGGSTGAQSIAAWDVGSDQVSIVSAPGGAVTGVSAFPSVSGDGRFVSFATNLRLNGLRTGIGPWVYVVDRSNLAFRLVSGVNETAYYSSLSRDATQVAFGVAAPGCQFPLNSLSALENGCPTLRIDVAFGPNAGLTGVFTPETVSLDVNGRIAGTHRQPDLSGNGRWVAWISDAGRQLIGSTDAALDEPRHAFTRRRDPGMSVDALDFGTITVNTTSTLTTTIRNTGRTTNSIDSLSPAPGSFTVQPGGSCFAGITLAPGGSCTVNIRFAAPAAATTVNGTLLVAEAGYDPISATGALTGRSTTGPTIPPPATTTTTTTTLPPGSGTPRPTTTTTIPKNLFLDATPNPIDFGQVAIGIPTAPQTITVTNTGSASGQLFVSIFGDHPDDFEIVGSTCEELILAPAASCTVDIRMNARDGGDRTALATITTAVGTVEVVLRGQGRFSPRLAASPQAVTDRSISTIIGQGFPPGDPVLVQIVGTPVSFNVTPDAEGKLRIPFSPLGKLPLGSYTLRVDALPTVYEFIETPLVVVLPTFKPQGPTGPAFGTSLLVTRGG